MDDDWRRCDWVEYPPKEQTWWRVIAFDHNGQASIMAEKCSKAEADDLAEKWISRPDVTRVEGREYSGT